MAGKQRLTSCERAAQTRATSSKPGQIRVALIERANRPVRLASRGRYPKMAVRRWRIRSSYRNVTVWQASPQVPRSVTGTNSRLALAYMTDIDRRDQMPHVGRIECPAEYPDVLGFFGAGGHGRPVYG